MSTRSKTPRDCAYCGGQFFPLALTARFCSRSCGASANAKYGADNNRHNGGLSTDSDGRTIVVFRDGGHMLYSRALMAGHIGRLLRPDELVHHINGDPFDDRIENLQIVSRAEHIDLHRDALNAARKARYLARAAAKAAA